MRRRNFLKNLVSAGLISASTGGVWASGKNRTEVDAAPGQDPRLVLLILRGGMDGLAAIAPYGDRNYINARRGLALPEPGRENGLLPLGGFFGAHPALVHWQRSFVAGEALAVHALASPYRQRSHFDAQNVLELGLSKPHISEQGWLNRAVPAVNATAVAIGQAIPLVLRGPEAVTSWSPDTLPEPDADTLSRLLDMYQHDNFLGRNLVAALAADEMSGVSGTGALKRRSTCGKNVSPLIEATAGFLKHPSGPRVAVLEVEAWDTHANQGLHQGTLANGLARLDVGLNQLQRALGEVWQQTVVLAVTEFGRTVAMNGTRGTDHGTASVALLTGGAVQGGRVLGDWPGLKPSLLYQGRDLMPTTDLRSVFRAVLGQHMGIKNQDLNIILPGSQNLPSPGVITKRRSDDAESS